MKRLVLVVALLALCSCKKKPSNVVARLEQMTAQVERMPREAAPWRGARVGDTFILGSAVRTGPDSTAKLRVGSTGKLDVSPSSVVYFTRTPGRDRNDVRVETGMVELEAGDEVIGVGEAVLEAGGRATLESSPDGTTILVRVGRVVLEDNVIEEGQRVTIGPAGNAVAARVVADAAVELPAGQSKVIVRAAPARVKTGNDEQELAIGEHQLATGATVTAPAGSVVEITRNGARAVTAGPSALRLGDDTTLVDVTSGSVELQAESADATIHVPGGSVTARRGGAATLTVDKNATAIDGQQGDTLITGKRDSKTIHAGQLATLTATGDVTVSPPAPDRTVVSIAAGESPVIHDAKAPVAVRVLFGDACASTGVVELARDRTFRRRIARSGGMGGANILVSPGSYSYRVRCVGGKGATGTLRVKRDSGRAPLPKTAARTTIDMDGREYTILYQNLLPEVTLAWRKAPPKPSYTFVIQPAKGAEKRITSPGPRLSLPPGELREGKYTTWVEAVLGARSEQSRIVIDFDNAAPSASLDLVAGDGLRVKGTVIEGSTVSASGTAIALDRHLRFESDLVPGEREDGVGVRIAHPKAGIHYYVMRR